ncbi:hypothetical protein [Zhengella mangrovi]|uniref:hypothetical protein n=1 Tax=Zhengella mangrovi TaxID=1982044 RepID=UPI00105470A2|nr:hypothetical protein [Zhengella mangrovi]
MRRFLALIFVIVTCLSTGTASAQSTATIHGIWKGTYACVGRVKTAFELTIRQVDENRLVAVFAFQRITPGTASGHYTMTGVIERSGVFALTPQNWVVQPRNYQMLALKGRYDQNADKVLADFETDNCFDVEISRAPLPELVMESWAILGLSGGEMRREAASNANRSPQGVWGGEYECAGGQKSLIEIVFQTQNEKIRDGARGEEFKILLSFKFTKGGNYEGSYVAYTQHIFEDGRIIVFGADWIKNPYGLDQAPLRGTYNPAKDVLDMKFDNNQCYNLHLRRIEKPTLEPSAWRMLGVIGPDEMVQVGEEIPLDGSVTTDRIFLYLRDSEYVNDLHKQCVEGTAAALSDTYNFAPLSQRAREVCGEYFSGRNDDSIRFLKPDLYSVNPGSTKLDWEKASVVSNGSVLDGGVVRYDLKRLPSGKCLVFKERDRNKSYGYAPVPVRLGQGDGRFMFKLMPEIDPAKERTLQGAYEAASSQKTTAETSIPRLRVALQNSAAWNGATCERPSDEPKLPDPPKTPDATMVRANAAAFCYEVLQRRLNPGEAYGAMKALFLDDVIAVHKQWSEGALPKLSCAMRPPSQVNDILARIFSGGLIGMEAIQLRFQSCMKEMVDSCEAPMAVYRDDVARRKEAHLRPYRQCVSNQSDLKAYEENMPKYIERAISAKNALDNYKKELRDRPRELSLVDARCVSGE